MKKIHMTIIEVGVLAIVILSAVALFLLPHTVSTKEIGQFLQVTKSAEDQVTIIIDRDAMHSKYGNDCIEPPKGYILDAAGIDTTKPFWTEVAGDTITVTMLPTHPYTAQPEEIRGFVKVDQSLGQTAVTLDRDAMYAKLGRDCVEPSPGSILSAGGVDTSKVKADDETISGNTITLRTPNNIEMPDLLPLYFMFKLFSL